ncbi:MAG TPA: ABC transporter permease [Vicinamibacterales bacterium]|nr:ABC transporter permease [Vicinamibacterales bacterium]
MSPYLARRLLFAAMLVFLVSSGALLLTRLAPGDFASGLAAEGVNPAEVARERARYGLDRPIVAQYLEWLSRAARLDLGTSLLYRRPVADLVWQRSLNTALLALAALLVATCAGLTAGVYTGSRRGAVASAVRGLSLVLLSLPSLVTSLVLVLLAARTGWLPVGGMGSAAASQAGTAGWLADLAWHLPLPALALALPIAATLERLQAQAVSEAIRQPFTLAALARGVPMRRVIWRHALRASLSPVASVYGFVLASLLSGSFIVEIVTAWPGLGRLLYDALRARDVYLVAGCAAAGSMFLAAGSLVSDLALAWADPRLRRP